MRNTIASPYSQLQPAADCLIFGQQGDSPAQGLRANDPIEGIACPAQRYRATGDRVKRQIARNQPDLSVEVIENPVGGHGGSADLEEVLQFQLHARRYQEVILFQQPGSLHGKSFEQAACSQSRTWVSR